MIAYIIHIIFLSYTALLFVRIMGSWFPTVAHSTFMRFIAYYTDPYLNIFRRFIPPIGNSLDLSPLIGFFALRIVEKLLLAFFR